MCFKHFYFSRRAIRVESIIHHHLQVQVSLMEEEDYYNPIPKASGWFQKILSFHADIIHNCIMILLSPFISVFSLASDSYRHAKEDTSMVEDMALKVPFKVTHGTMRLLSKTGFGIAGAIHVCVVLMVVMLLAAMLGVGLVQLRVEKPVYMREELFFDYTDENPEAVFTFDGDGIRKSTRQTGIPPGHTFQVSLLLVMPESDYNREIGMFQLTAELLSTNRDVMVKSSQSCMLRFRSLPIQLLRTSLMSVPLILGISEETQKISLKILRHKESYPRSKALRVTLIPRARTAYLPQLYEAEILLNSQLPWIKVVSNWKWTFCVWASLYIYSTLLLIILCYCRALVFPVTAMHSGYHHYSEREHTQELKELQAKGRDEQEISELMRKWQQRRKRKAIFLDRDVVDGEFSLASSMSIIGEAIGLTIENDTGDSESVC